jgi:uracil-DNA glycosylase
MPAPQTADQAFDSLRWYAQMGVDLCVEEVPQRIVARKEDVNAIAPPPARGSLGGGHADLGAQSMPSPQPSREGIGGSIQSAPPASIASAVAQARALADAATDLAALEAAVRGFEGCGLKKTATNTVFAQGVAASGLMFIGEAPGAEEDRAGVPFCGPSGQLLDTMLGFIGLKRAENFYITNTLFWRPPGNRQPTKDELAICQPFVEKHIALVNPKLLVLVGGTATASVLGDARGITRLRGQVFSYTNQYMSNHSPLASARSEVAVSPIMRW